MTTQEELRLLIQEQFDIPAASIAPDVPISEYGLDSLSLAELMFKVEEHFGVDLPPSKQHVDTLAGLVEVIDELRVAKAA